MYFLLNLSHYVKGYGHFVKCPLTKYGNVTLPKKHISIFKTFSPNSTFNIKKSHKNFYGKALYFRSYQPKKTPVPLGLRNLSLNILEEVKSKHRNRS